MKKMNIKFPVLLMALALGFSSCQKDNSSTTDSTAGIKLQALNKSFSLPVLNSNVKASAIESASIAWDTARIIVSSIKFEAEMKSTISDNDSIEFEYKWNGPQEINLFDSTLSLGNLVLQPGFYDEIELKVECSAEDAGEKPVFYLHGLYTMNDSVTLPISFVVNEDIRFKTERGSVEITSADIAVFSSTIQLYLDQLMLDVQVSALENAVQTNGTIVISADSNSEVYNLIMQNLRKDHHCEHSHHHGDHHDD